jgi:hypothetical protein
MRFEKSVVGDIHAVTKEAAIVIHGAGSRFSSSNVHHLTEFDALRCEEGSGQLPSADQAHIQTLRRRL